jgi:hypothetical protein
VDSESETEEDEDIIMSDLEIGLAKTAQGEANMR